jgi:hypothetical protein
MTATLRQDIEDVPLLIHGPPEIVPLTVNREKDLIQRPFIARSGTSTAQLSGRHQKPVGHPL